MLLETLSSVYTYQFQQIAMDLCLPLLNFPQKTDQPAEAQIHPEASRSWQDPGPWSPGAARLVPTSNVLPSAQPFTSLMHQQWHYIMKRVTNFGWEYIILWKQKNKISEIGWNYKGGSHSKQQVMLNSRQYKQSNATLRKQANITALLSAILFYF